MSEAKAVKTVPPPPEAQIVEIVLGSSVRAWSIWPHCSVCRITWRLGREALKNSRHSREPTLRCIA